MNVALRGIDVGDHLIDRHVAVRSDPRAVAASGVELVDGSCERERRLVRTCTEPVEAGGVADRARQAGVNIAPMLAPAAADPRFAEDQVGDDSEQRERDDHDDPREPRRRFAMRLKEDTGEDRKVG